jgi:hypothetical protein
VPRVTVHPITTSTSSRPAHGDANMICLYLITPVHALNIIASAEPRIETQQRYTSMSGTRLEHDCPYSANWAPDGTF